MSDPRSVHGDGGGSGDGDGSETGGGSETATLPPAVRQKLVSLAASALGALPADEVPPPLRRVARFAPNRRSRLAGHTITAQLERDPVFRQRVATRVVEHLGEAGAAIAAGVPPTEADPVEVAALAYLTRTSGWRETIASAGEHIRAGAADTLARRRIGELEQRLAHAERARTAADNEADKLRDELDKLRQDSKGLRERVRLLTRQAREAIDAQSRTEQALVAEKGRAARADVNHDAELRRLRARVKQLETAAGQARSTAREQRAVDDSRLWLLLETISRAAVGLRRELALDPADTLPADVVADDHAQRPDGVLAPSSRALAADDPARIDELLALPRCHLIVDGYNVTKRGYGDLPLEQQRTRLVSGLGGIAAQTGAEVTVAFDGTEHMVSLAPPPRGLRVLFSTNGETADELIRRLVRAEPPGRPVVVISSDREVVNSARRHGGYALSSDTLLRRLARG